MQPDEFFWRDGLRFIAAAAHGLEVAVSRDNVVRLGGDGAVGKFVVVFHPQRVGEGAFKGSAGAASLTESSGCFLDWRLSFNESFKA
jgi:hypothetical protein